MASTSRGTRRSSSRTSGGSSSSSGSSRRSTARSEGSDENLSQLRDRARKLGVTGRWSMSKGELLDAVKKANRRR